MKKRAKCDDVWAIYSLGCYYDEGKYGLRQSHGKANELWLRAGQLGLAEAYHNIAVAYRQGDGVERDEKKAKHYYTLAAMGGHVDARYNLGNLEGRAGKKDRALKHWMISAGAGDDDSLKEIRKCFVSGHATKEDFEKALRAHKEAADEMKSEQREAAAAYIDTLW